MVKPGESLFDNFTGYTFTQRQMPTVRKTASFFSINAGLQGNEQRLSFPLKLSSILALLSKKLDENQHHAASSFEY